MLQISKKKVGADGRVADHHEGSLNDVILRLCSRELCLGMVPGHFWSLQSASFKSCRKPCGYQKTIVATMQHDQKDRLGGNVSC